MILVLFACRVVVALQVNSFVIFNDVTSIHEVDSSQAKCFLSIAQRLSDKLVPHCFPENIIINFTSRGCFISHCVIYMFTLVDFAL